MLSIFVLTGCIGGDKTSNNDGSVEIQFQAVDVTDLEKDKIIATYIGGEITGAEFTQYLAIQAFLNPFAPINDLDYRKNTMKDFILEKVTSSRVQDDTWATQQVDVIWQQLLQSYDDATLKAAYSILNINEAIVKEGLASLLKVERFFQEQITENDLIEFYETVSDQFTAATFSHILIAINEDEAKEEFPIRNEDEAFQLANDLYSQLQSGAVFTELVKEYSDDVASIENGGRYVNVGIMNLVPEFKNTLLSLPLDTFSQPVKTEFGYHLIHLEELKVRPLDEVKELLKGEVTHKKYLDFYFDELPQQIIEITL